MYAISKQLFIAIAQYITNKITVVWYWFTSQTVTAIILFSYLPCLKSFFPPISFPLCQPVKSKLAVKTSLQHNEHSQVYSADTRQDLQPLGRDKWYELDWSPVKYSIQLEWDIQKSFPLASCLDCFYFLSLHWFSFSLNGNTHGGIKRERQIERWIMKQRRILHPWFYVQGTSILWGSRGISPISSDTLPKYYMSLFIIYTVFHLLSGGSCIAVMDVVTVFRKNELLTDWKANNNK